jgi:hypothetical protein
MSDPDSNLLKEVAKANRALVLRMKNARNRDEADRMNRFSLLHHSIFVQLREELVKRGLPPTAAAEATQIADSPFSTAAVLPG